MRHSGGRAPTYSVTYTHHHAVARGSVHLHRDIETYYPHLARGFTLQSMLRCATYPLSRHKHSKTTTLPTHCPHCPPNAPKAKETYDHLVFTCQAWKQDRIEAAWYTITLLNPLRADIQMVTDINARYTHLLRKCDGEISRICTPACSQSCWRQAVRNIVTTSQPGTPHTITSPGPPGTAPMACLPRRTLRTVPTLPPRLQDTLTLGTCTGNDHCPTGDRLSTLLAQRTVYCDVLNLHGFTALLTMPHGRIPAELNTLCQSSLTHVYSSHGRMQLIDVFVHVYISRFLINIEKKRKH